MIELFIAGVLFTATDAEDLTQYQKAQVTCETGKYCEIVLPPKSYATFCRVNPPKEFLLTFGYPGEEQKKVMDRNIHGAPLQVRDCYTVFNEGIDTLVIYQLDVKDGFCVVREEE